MAVQETSPTTTPSAEVVGRAFVEQYYQILHESPDSVYKFYQDSSILSRADSSGAMTSVKTMQAINDKILSLNYKDYKVEIETADAQDSHQGGVLVLVTGCLTGKDNVRRKFTQTFFLAPQTKGYYVSNDVSRFVDDSTSHRDDSVFVNNTSGNGSPTILEDDAEPIHVSDHTVLEPATSPEAVVETEAKVEDEVKVEVGSEAENSISDKKENDSVDIEGAEPVIEETVSTESPTESKQIEAPSVVVEPSSASAEDTSKRSYAAIVKVNKGGKISSRVYAPATVRAAPPNIQPKSHTATVSAAPAAAAVAPANDAPPESSNVHEEVAGYSIYVKNLPYNATMGQLDDEFKKFGPIKRNGIQVRSSKGFCFGFVEFESRNSMQGALKASPIIIGGREAIVEIKKTTNRVGSNGRGGRYPPGRGGGYRNESMNGRMNMGGYRGGYSRNEFKNQGNDFRNQNSSDFSGPRRRGVIRNRETYQPVAANQNGGGRGGNGAVY